MQKLFVPADILLPKKQHDYTAFSVVACDQYTSEPLVWEQTKQIASGHLSAYDMIFPEVYLNEGEAAFDARIAAINKAMADAMQADAFDLYEQCYFYIERRQRNGLVRRGLIGAIDLEGYDFAHSPTDDPQTPIRATEGTVLSRIPPRVKIRENAPLELPHVMVLVDDPNRKCIEVIGSHTDRMEQVYDFELMQNSGHLTGWKVNKSDHALIDGLIEGLSDKDGFYAQYPMAKNAGKQPLVLAVGDGNHSLATARQCWDNIKGSLTPQQRERHPARYALCEICNLHDDALLFEPIHRIVTDVDANALLAAMTACCGLSASGEGQALSVVVNGVATPYVITKPTAQLTVGSLQNFLDVYCKQNGGEIDYIHGADVVKTLSQKENSIGFLLYGMEKEQLYPTVIFDKALPRKTFSMGDAWDKRFYLEARKIRED